MIRIPILSSPRRRGLSPARSAMPLCAWLLLPIAPAPVFAQAMIQPLPGTTDADRLADTMRELGQRPQDVGALIRAGDLSLRLGDLSAAASFFARADKVDPRNGAVKGGMAAILVRSERPGEALRYFAQAQAFGVDPALVAADRGLAYDLIGEQRRAQIDYKLALKGPADDETVRRYALSLGISGRKDEALEVLAPLVAKSDRGAWRARAFVLAMNGDVAGAEHIATTMMPGMAAGLQPFFQRLPTLSPIDRAFAVHFGEVHPTSERLADAHLAPAMAPLPPEPVMVAAQTAAPPVEQKDKRRERKPKAVKPATQVARVDAARPPSYRVPTTPASMPAPAPTVAALVPSRPAALQPSPAAVVTAVPTRSGVIFAAPGTTGAVSPVAPAVVLAQRPAATVAAQPVPATPVPARPVPATIARPGFSTVPTQVAAAPATVPAAKPSPIVAPVSPPTTVVPTPTPSFAVAPAYVQPVPVTPAPVATPPAASTERAQTPQARASEDSILARIVAGLSIPASELDVEAPEKPVARPSETADAARVIAEAEAKADRDAVARQALAEKVAADKQAAADKKKAVATKKALAAKKVAAEEKAAADKEAAEEKRIARANPERIWVQVSGGAYGGDLPKAWSAVKAKAPEAFAGRHGWTTPLRATNRVLTGPFKTDAEARSFVNQLAKKGISAFTFTSDAGQTVARLPAK